MCEAAMGTRISGGGDIQERQRGVRRSEAGVSDRDEARGKRLRNAKK